MKTLAASMLLCGSAAIGLWACAGDGVDRSHQIAETPTLSVRTVAATAVGETHGDDPLGWRAPGFRQRYTAINFNSVVVTDFAEGTGGAWFSVAHQSSATFYVMRVACGGLDRYAVLGLTRDERPVVELWRLVPSDESAVVVSGNGAGVPASLVPKVFEKRRIYTGSPGSGALALEYDPADRFVLAAIEDAQGVARILQLDTDNSPATPVVLADSISMPVLARMSFAQKGDHAVLGRVFEFTTDLSDYVRLLFVDANNDGVFDGAPLVGDAAYWSSSGFDRYEDWTALDH